MSFVVPPYQRFADRAMGGRWRTFKLQFICFVVLILGLGPRGSSSLNLEGLNLLQFRARVESDPYNALASWDPEDNDSCNWLGVQCVDGEVHVLDLSGLYLGGTLAPELGNLGNLRALVLHTNHLLGGIPVELGFLSHLEVLDLRDNHLSGVIPGEIAKLVSLKRLLLCNNNFEGTIPQELEELSLLSELQYDEYLASVSNRKISLRPNSGTNSWLSQGDSQSVNLESSYVPNALRNAYNLATVERRILAEQSSNVEAVPDNVKSPIGQVNQQPIFRSSGSFPAAIGEKNPFKPGASQQGNKPAPVGQSHPEKEKSSQKVWVYVAVGIGVIFLMAVAAALFFMWRSRGAKPIGPFKTGISGQLQKAFITGVPKLNRPELESACEDFSNIIATFDGFTMYKGTLSSGVEIAVASTAVSSSLDWSEAAELAYRTKIATLSRVNHKNYVNLLGYCEEQEPFTRMMVFEYAPSGSLFEHIHVKEVEHLDWNARMRIIMGAAYCLQYMHHDLNPPVVHSDLSSAAVHLTDDNAAKLAEKAFEVLPKAKAAGEDGKNSAGSTRATDRRDNVYAFGMLLLEIITGRLPYSEEEGYLLDWASPRLSDKELNKDLIDPMLKSIKTNELDAVCEAIQACIRPNPLDRPTMQEITSRLKEAIPLPPDAAVPRLSPLWWAELEILSVEAS